MPRWSTMRHRCGPWCEICWRSIASLRWWSITWPVANSPWDCSATSARVSCRPWRFSSSTRTTRGPVYDYQIKQEWEKHVYYQCPAQLSPAESKAIEKVARETFEALDCRDVARVDLRMDEGGNFYVLEVNPLPGLTPDYSDLFSSPRPPTSTTAH